jgi:hypothetical protein
MIFKSDIASIFHLSQIVDYKENQDKGTLSFTIKDASSYHKITFANLLELSKLLHTTEIDLDEPWHKDVDCASYGWGREHGQPIECREVKFYDEEP